MIGRAEMIRLAEAGKVKTIIFKDMSRMGRDHRKVGYNTESFFAQRDLRYLAINNGVDSDKGNTSAPTRPVGIRKPLNFCTYAMVIAGGTHRRSGAAVSHSPCGTYRRTHLPNRVFL